MGRENKKNNENSSSIKKNNAIIVPIGALGTGAAAYGITRKLIKDRDEKQFRETWKKKLLEKGMKSYNAERIAKTAPVESIGGNIGTKEGLRNALIAGGLTAIATPIVIKTIKNRKAKKEDEEEKRYSEGPTANKIKPKKDTTKAEIIATASLGTARSLGSGYLAGKTVDNLIQAGILKKASKLRKVKGGFSMEEANLVFNNAEKKGRRGGAIAGTTVGLIVAAPTIIDTIKELRDRKKKDKLEKPEGQKIYSESEESREKRAGKRVKKNALKFAGAGLAAGLGSGIAAGTLANESRQLATYGAKTVTIQGKALQLMRDLTVKQATSGLTPEEENIMVAAGTLAHPDNYAAIFNKVRSNPKIVEEARKAGKEAGRRSGLATGIAVAAPFVALSGAALIANKVKRNKKKNKSDNSSK